MPQWEFTIKKTGIMRDVVKSLNSNTGQTIPVPFSQSALLDANGRERGLVCVPPGIEVVDFNLRNIVESAVQLCAEKADRKGIELACMIHRNVPELVRGDPVRVKQVLSHLISNAVKFTEKGEVVARVSLVEDSPLHAVLQFAVSDTGIGIDRTRKRRLFEAFSQADSSATSRFGKTGLGLTIARRLVELMGGTIDATGDVGKGSTFWFTLKLVKQDHAEERHARRRVDFSTLRALVVDDNSANRGILREQLASWGCVVAEAASGRVAIDMLSHASSAGRPFRIALVDEHMPVMSGLELGQAVKANPMLGPTALIMLRSLSGSGSSRIKELGFATCIAKPVRETDLYESILDALAGRAAKADPASSRAGSTPSCTPQAFNRILIADDNEINRELVRDILTQSGYECSSVANGREAFEAAQTGEYDLILMDCQMPDLDGFAATRLIRAWEAGRRSDPRRRARTAIIALTANAMNGDRERCLAAGMDGYLGKPLEPEVMLATLGEWLTDRVGKTVVKEEQKTRAAEARAQGHHPHQAAADGGAADPVDIAQFLILCRGNAAFAAEVMVKFETQASEDARGLIAAVAQGNPGAVRELAHRLKGASANLSAEGLRCLAEQLEGMGLRGDLAGAGPCVDRLISELERFRQYTAQWRESGCGQAHADGGSGGRESAGLTQAPPGRSQA